MFTALNPRWPRKRSASRPPVPTPTRKPRASTKVDDKPTLNKIHRPKKAQDIPLQDLSHLRSAAHANIATNDIAPRPPPLSGSSSSTGTPSSRSSSMASMVTAKTHLDDDILEAVSGGTDVIDFGDPDQAAKGWYRSRGLPVPSQEVLERRVKAISTARAREIEAWQKSQVEEAEKRKIAKQMTAKQRQRER